MHDRCCDPVRHSPSQGPDRPSLSAGLDHDDEPTLQGLESRTPTERIRNLVGTLQGRLRIGKGHFILDRKWQSRCGIRWRIRKRQTQWAWRYDLSRWDS